MCRGEQRDVVRVLEENGAGRKMSDCRGEFENEQADKVRKRGKKPKKRRQEEVYMNPLSAPAADCLSCRLS